MDLSRILLIFVILIGATSSSEERDDQTVNYAAIDSPFRSQKVNMIWNKAR